jgi:hypothetical protein
MQFKFCLVSKKNLLHIPHAVFIQIEQKLIDVVFGVFPLALQIFLSVRLIDFKLSCKRTNTRQARIPDTPALSTRPRSQHARTHTNKLKWNQPIDIFIKTYLLRILLKLYTPMVLNLCSFRSVFIKENAPNMGLRVNHYDFVALHSMWIRVYVS